MIRDSDICYLFKPMQDGRKIYHRVRPDVNEIGPDMWNTFNKHEAGCTSRSAWAKRAKNWTFPNGQRWMLEEFQTGQVEVL